MVLCCVACVCMFRDRGDHDSCVRQGQESEQRLRLPPRSARQRYKPITLVVHRMLLYIYIYIYLYETPILVFNSPDNPDIHSYDNPDNRGLCGRHAVFPGVSDGHSVTGGDRHLRPLRRAHLPVAHDVSHSSSFNLYIHPLFSCLYLSVFLSLSMIKHVSQS